MTELKTKEIFDWLGNLRFCNLTKIGGQHIGLLHQKNHLRA